VARVRNLLQLAARMALRPVPGNLSVQVSFKRPGSASAQPLTIEQLTGVHAKDELWIAGRNRDAGPVDLSIFWVGADASIRRVFPEDARASVRLDPGAAFGPVGLAINAGAQGTDRLLVLSHPAEAAQPSTDFRFLAQGPAAAARTAVDPGLQALYDACFADHLQRGDQTPAPPAERLGLRAYTFQIRP